MNLSLISYISESLSTLFIKPAIHVDYQMVYDIDEMTKLIKTTNSFISCLKLTAMIYLAISHALIYCKSP